MNRLFCEQDPKDPKAVVPVFFSFPIIPPVEETQFCLNYLGNFLRFYIGFYTRNHRLPQTKKYGQDLLRLLNEAKPLLPPGQTVDWLLEVHAAFEAKQVPIPTQEVMQIPRTVADVDGTNIVVFLDELQNTKLPRHGFDIAGNMQHAVESRNCPHIVTGSAMSIIGKEILGRGALFGRFSEKKIKGMTFYWGTQLALKTAKFYEVELPQPMAAAIAERCGGNPFYIQSVVRQSLEQNRPILNINILNDVLAVDICSGFIWAELREQVERWMEEINGKNITKWILYLSAFEENLEKDENPDKETPISLERLQEEIQQREGIQVSTAEIKKVLIQLSRGDLVEFYEFGEMFLQVKDPILQNFLQVWGKTEVENQPQGRVTLELQTRFQEKFQRSFAEYQGYLAEAHVSQVLFNGQQRTLPGRFFHSAEDISLPRFAYVQQRRRLGMGENREIDVYGGAMQEAWICECKWQQGKVGKKVLEDFLTLAGFLRKKESPPVLRMWLFAKDGLTREAEAFAREKEILWSARIELDPLLRFLDLRPLFDFDPAATDND